MCKPVGIPVEIAKGNLGFDPPLPEKRKGRLSPSFTSASEKSRDCLHRDFIHFFAAPPRLCARRFFLTTGPEKNQADRLMPEISVLANSVGAE
jgi:hypothetical protein